MEEIKDLSPTETEVKFTTSLGVEYQKIFTFDSDDHLNVREVFAWLEYNDKLTIEKLEEILTELNEKWKYRKTYYSAIKHKSTHIKSLSDLSETSIFLQREDMKDEVIEGKSRLNITRCPVFVNSLTNRIMSICSKMPEDTTEYYMYSLMYKKNADVFHCSLDILYDCDDMTNEILADLLGCELIDDEIHATDIRLNDILEKLDEYKDRLINSRKKSSRK